MILIYAKNICKGFLRHAHHHRPFFCSFDLWKDLFSQVHDTISTRKDRPYLSLSPIFGWVNYIDRSKIFRILDISADEVYHKTTQRIRNTDQSSFT